jgi:hypothetical protein
VFDGVFLLRPELNLYWDFRIFVNVSIEAAKERAVKRDSIWMDGKVKVIAGVEQNGYNSQVGRSKESRKP